MGRVERYDGAEKCGDEEGGDGPMCEDYPECGGLEYAVRGVNERYGWDRFVCL